MSDVILGDGLGPEGVVSETWVPLEVQERSQILHCLGNQLIGGKGPVARMLDPSDKAQKGNFSLRGPTGEKGRGEHTSQGKAFFQAGT